jgi:acetolactate synthase-1/3 small subunit
VKAQLGRLIDVIEVQELKEGDYFNRELLLARIRTNGSQRSAIEDIAQRFGAKLAQSTDRGVVIEATGDTKTLDQLVEQLRPYGIATLGRTGRGALEKQP